ncbi:MAG TPA: hypothetical protein VFW65_10280 [Pseudonocardiaceae bacterium]|nr:hypothetical protein [Pseudonocardiaceae bacterium]
MSLSDKENRQLAAVDRVLSGDPVLRAVADLFPRPALPFLAGRPVVRRSTRRLLLIMVWSLAAVAVGLATTILAVTLARPMELVGPSVMLAAAVAFVVAAIRRGARVVESQPVAVAG